MSHKLYPQGKTVIHPVSRPLIIIQRFEIITIHDTSLGRHHLDGYRYPRSMNGTFSKEIAAVGRALAEGERLRSESYMESWCPKKAQKVAPEDEDTFSSSFFTLVK